MVHVLSKFKPTPHDRCLALLLLQLSYRCMFYDEQEGQLHNPQGLLRRLSGRDGTSCSLTHEQQRDFHPQRQLELC